MVKTKKQIKFIGLTITLEGEKKQVDRAFLVLTEFFMEKISKKW